MEDLRYEKLTKEKALTSRELRQGEELDSASLRGLESLAALYAKGNGYKAFAKLIQIKQIVKLVAAKSPLINFYFH